MCQAGITLGVEAWVDGYNSWLQLRQQQQQLNQQKKKHHGLQLEQGQAQQGEDQDGRQPSTRDAGPAGGTDDLASMAGLDLDPSSTASNSGAAAAPFGSQTKGLGLTAPGGLPGQLNPSLLAPGSAGAGVLVPAAGRGVVHAEYAQVVIEDIRQKEFGIGECPTASFIAMLPRA